MAAITADPIIDARLLAQLHPALQRMIERCGIPIGGLALSEANWKLIQSGAAAVGIALRNAVGQLRHDISDGVPAYGCPN